MLLLPFLEIHLSKTNRLFPLFFLHFVQISAVFRETKMKKTVSRMTWPGRFAKWWKAEALPCLARPLPRMMSRQPAPTLFLWMGQRRHKKLKWNRRLRHPRQNLHMPCSGGTGLLVARVVLAASSMESLFRVRHLLEETPHLLSMHTISVFVSFSCEAVNSASANTKRFLGRVHWKMKCFLSNNMVL